QNAPDDLGNLAMQQRLAAGNRHHRRAAFIDGLQAFANGEPLVQNLVRIVDLAATRASKIATEQRLEHEHEWIALATREMLKKHVGPDHGFLQKRNPQEGLLPFGSKGLVQVGCDAIRRSRVSSTGRRNSIVSSRPGKVETSTGPSRCNAAMTSSTRTSGAEAPAVIPTVLASRTQAGSSSLPSAIR